MSFYKIRPRAGTASQWTTANPVLAEREIGFEFPAGGIGTGEIKAKMGDGEPLERPGVCDPADADCRE